MEGLQLGMRSIPIAVWYLGKYLEMLVLNLIKKCGDTHHENQGKTSLSTNIKTQAVITRSIVLQLKKMIRIVQDGCSDINKFVTYETPTGKHQSSGVMCQRWLAVFREPLVTIVLLDAAGGISLVHLLPPFPETTTTIKALCKTLTCFSEALGMKILIIIKQNKN